MARRVLEVQVTGDASSLERALGRGGRAAQQFGGKTSVLGGQMQSLARVMRTLAVAGAGVAVGLGGAAVSSAAKFEKQLSSLEAVADANGDAMERFRKQAMKAGADTAYSAREAAVAQTELAKGGVAVSDILGGGLDAALSLAAAGELELGDAAAYTANAMNLFGLEGKDSQKIADAFATAANATTADVSDFGIALSQSGSVAKSAGLSFYENVTALEALAKAGIKGSDAGTSVKAALIALLKPSLEQAGAADALGLKFINSAGHMKSMADLSAHLRDKLGGLTSAQRTAALATVAGTDGVRTLTALYDAGPRKLEKYEQGLRKSGTAAETAKTKQDNLAGSIEQLQGSMETLGIQVGSLLVPPLRDAAKYVTQVFNDIGEGKNPLERIGGDLKDAFESVDWDALGAKVSDGLKSALDGMGDVLGGVDWSAVGTQISAGLSEALDFTGTLPGAIAAGLAMAVSRVDGEKVLGGLLTVVSEALEALMKPSFWIENFKAIFSIVTFVIPVGKILKIPGFGFLYKRISLPLFKAVGAVGKGLLSLFGKVATEGFVGFLAGLERAFPRVANALLKLVTMSGKELGKLPGKWKALASKAIQAIADAWLSGASKVGEAAGRLVGAALSKVSGAVRGFGAAARKWGRAMADKLGGLAGEVGAAVLGWGKQALAALGQTAIGMAARKWGAKIVAGITAYYKAAFDAARGLGAKVVEPLHNLGARFLELGKNLMQGLINGVKSMAGSVKDAIVSTVTDPIGAAKKLLGIESPSKVMRDIGLNIGQGLSLGIKAGEAGVSGSLKSGLLFPVEAAIRDLEAKRDRLEASWAKADARRDLAATLADAATSSSTTSDTTSSSRSSSSSAGGVIPGGEFLQGFGLSVAESKYFGGVTTNRHGHYENDHYSGNSIDVNDPRGGQAEYESLSRALKQLKEKFGESIQQAFIEDAGTANQHLHATFKYAGEAMKAAVTKVTAGVRESADATAGGLNRVFPVTRVGQGGAKLSERQARAVFEAAGFTPEQAQWMMQISKRESGLRPGIVQHDPGDGMVGYGLVQNTPGDKRANWGPEALEYMERLGGRDAMRNPLQNAKMAKYLFDHGGASHWNATNGNIPMPAPGSVKSVGSVDGLVRGGDGASIADGAKAMRDFGREAERAAKLAKFDAELRGLQNITAWRDALGGIASDLKGKVSSALDVYAEKWEKDVGASIDRANEKARESLSDLQLIAMDAFDRDTERIVGQGPAAQALARLQAEAEAVALAAEDAANAQSLEDARRTGDPRQVKAAQEAIAETNRQRALTAATAAAEGERATIEVTRAEQRKTLEREQAEATRILETTQQEDRDARRAEDLEKFRINLHAQTDAELASLTLRQQQYGQFAKNVNAILAKAGLAETLDVSAEVEAAITAEAPTFRPGSAGWQQAWETAFAGTHGGVSLTDYQAGKRASGGGIQPGRVYRVGELGPEDITVGAGGPRVVPASQSSGRTGGGGDIHMHGPVHIGSYRAAQILANKLAFKMKYGS